MLPALLPTSTAAMGDVPRLGGSLVVHMGGVWARLVSPASTSKARLVRAVREDNAARPSRVKSVRVRARRSSCRLPAQELARTGGREGRSEGGWERMKRRVVVVRGEGKIELSWPRPFKSA